MSSPTTIYLHGYSGDRQGLQYFAEAMNLSPAELWELPGFKAEPQLPLAAKTDIRAYSQLVWQEIDTKYPQGGLRLVGHSHGAMVAYALASQHPERIEELVLVCPVAEPRWPTRILIKSIRGLASALSDRQLMFIIRSRPMVSAIGHYMGSRHWSRAGRRRVHRIRRQESKQYSRQMIDLFEQALSFTDIMNKSSVSVPTTMCYAVDDNIAGKADLDWYFTRCQLVNRSVAIKGGHLAVLAEPERVARALR